MLDDSRDLLEIERYSECILLVFIEVLNESAGKTSSLVNDVASCGGS